MKKTAIARAFVMAAALSAVSFVAVAQQRPTSEEAAKVLKSAKPLAEEGNANAQYNMGVLYDEGYGVERNYAAARSWYEKAAAQNYAKAEHNLGIMYQEGHGVPADAAKAAEWFERAAEHGEPAAQNNLAVMYVRGQGKPQDLGKAALWAARAAEAGNESAISNLPQIAQNLPRSRIDGDNVNIRSEPSTSGRVLRQADRNTQVTVLDTRDDWAEVLFPKDYTVGWVAGFLLAGSSAPLQSDSAASDTSSTGGDVADMAAAATDDETPPAAEPTPEKAMHIDGSVVNIRARPTTNADVLFQARQDDPVNVIDSANDWSQVRFPDGRTGWVASFLLAE
ncbi:SH3 domain-containing protein [Salinisphaera aquimarina]|uniref:SH3 domain-containing protein n=1 Tax=Salinisphaera aquimarina TaxID=2094031 RepID=A0ABV7EW10_9GAMM